MRRWRQQRPCGRPSAAGATGAPVPIGGNAGNGAGGSGDLPVAGEDHYPHSVTVDNPGLTRYVIEQLDPATWYFVATALSADGESPPSNVVAMEVL